MYSCRVQLDQSKKERRELNSELEDARDRGKTQLRKIEDLEFSKSSLGRKIQGLEGIYTFITHTTIIMLAFLDVNFVQMTIYMQLIVLLMFVSLRGVLCFNTTTR